MHGRVRVTLRDVDATLANLYLPPDTAVVLERRSSRRGVDATLDAQGGVRPRRPGADRQPGDAAARRGRLAGHRAVADLRADQRERRRTAGRGAASRSPGAPPCTIRGPARPNRFEMDRLKLVVDGLDASGRSPRPGHPHRGAAGRRRARRAGHRARRPARPTLRARISRVDLAFWAPYLAPARVQRHGRDRSHGGRGRRAGGRRRGCAARATRVRGSATTAPPSTARARRRRPARRSARRRPDCELDRPRRAVAEGARGAPAPGPAARDHRAGPRGALPDRRTSSSRSGPRRRPRRGRPRREAGARDHRRARARDRRGRGRGRPACASTTPR